MQTPQATSLLAALLAGVCPTLPAAGQTCSVERDKLVPNDTGGLFGRSVAMNGATLVVGTWGDDDNGSQSGSVYLFDAATGQQTAKLYPEDAGAGDYFGFSVAIDGITVVVGAKGDEPNGVFSGSAYLFDAATGQQTAKLIPQDGDSYDIFGQSVAIDGATVVVGAPRDEVNGSDAGSAYVFDAATGQQTAKLLPSDGASWAYFGWSVAVSGSIAVVGAYKADAFGQESGTAYLFDTTTGQELAKLVPDDASLLDQFGSSVAIQGTLALVGAAKGNGTAITGSAYLFDATTGQQLAKYAPGDGFAYQLFGSAVALDGDLIVVGSTLDDDNGPGSGSVYVFDTTTGQELAKVVSSDGTDNDGFGGAVAVAGETLLVGAAGQEATGFNSGAAYVYGLLSAPSTYCTAKTNSLGCVPAIDATGRAGFSEPDPFPITAREVLNHRPGLFFYGTGGRAALPFLGGTLCTLPPLQRTPILVSGGNPTGNDCSGAYLFDFNAWIASGADPGLAPGQRVQGQFWSRDPSHPDGTGVGLTDAIELDLCP